MAKELAWAQAHFAKNNPQYALFDRFYKGEHPTQFAASKLTRAFGQIFAGFCDNLCPATVDVFSDRLQVGGFTSTSPAAQSFISDLWKSLRMDIRAGRIHSQTIRLGDAYVIAALDSPGKPNLYLQSPGTIAVRFDPDGSERIVEAIKAWRLPDGRMRVNRYFPDATYRYVTPRKASTLPANLSSLQRYSEDGEDPEIENNTDRVPVFRFNNSAEPEEFAVSELRDVIPLQLALNKSIIDMMVGAEYQALPQRWATGLESEVDPVTGKTIPMLSEPGSILRTPSTEAKFGEFGAANLDQFLSVQDSFRQEISRVSKTPAHLMLLNSAGGWPSGESLKTAEAPLTAKVKDRQILWGDVWEDVMQYMCIISEIDPGTIETQWLDTTPINTTP